MHGFCEYGVNGNGLILYDTFVISNFSDGRKMGSIYKKITAKLTVIFYICFYYSAFNTLTLVSSNILSQLSLKSPSVTK